MKDFLIFCFCRFKDLLSESSVYYALQTFFYKCRLLVFSARKQTLYSLAHISMLKYGVFILAVTIKSLAKQISIGGHKLLMM